MEAIQRMGTALSAFEFAWRLYYACHHKTFDPNLIGEAFTIQTGGLGLQISERRYSYSNLEDASYNLFLSATGSLVITFDEAAKELWKGSLNDNNLEDGLKMVYMLRCAFAHSPLMPKWEVRHEEYRKLSIMLEDGAHIEFNGCDLHDKNLMMDDIGGWEGFYNLIKFLYKEAKNT